MPSTASDSLLAHMVYFQLEDNSPAARQTLVDACRRLLTGHAGTAFFAVGSLSDLNRDVNDRDWDVGLHLVFESRAAHDQYQAAERHLQFIRENKSNWKRVRVFDADCPANR